MIIACNMSACNATELEDRCFPMMAITDVRLEKVRFAYGFPELSQKDNTDIKEFRNFHLMVRIQRIWEF